MMVPKLSKRSLTLAGAALVLGATAGAQSVQRKTNALYKRAPAPTRQASLDLDTGVYTHGPLANDRGGSTVADFVNSDAFNGGTPPIGWITNDSGAGACTWFCAASKGTGVNQSSNASDLMASVFFYYCSSALDVASGGLGGSVTLGFYEGYTVFGGAPTTTAAVVALTGMPASSKQGSWFSGTAACFGLTVNFDPLLPFADGAFVGYSWNYTDVGTDGVLGNTYPFTACVVSCSAFSIFNPSFTGFGGAGTASGLGEDGQGMYDVWVQVCPVGPHSGGVNSFSFGTNGTPGGFGTRSSVNMAIREASDLATTNVNYNALTSPNADTLTATNATLGTRWTLTLTRAVVSAAGVMTINVRRNKGGPNGLPPTPPVTGRVLIAGPFLASLPGSHNGTTGSVGQDVPLDITFCSLHFAAQARVAGGGIRLSSGVEGTVGTF